VAVGEEVGLAQSIQHEQAGQSSISRRIKKFLNSPHRPDRLVFLLQPVASSSKISGFHGFGYEVCRLLGYKIQFVLHRRHITSPLQSPAAYCYVRFEVFTAVTMKNAVFWDITSQFILHRRHITSLLQSPAG
jgi:hypothetical protein